ncbi:MAG: cytochrome b/b6 domain-containing protein [Burkholderiales bacterium]|nr:cytochrome b/b6 domain-containing protein [Burkholderiales bacterium]
MNRILVWDLPLRLFHWLLVALVVVSVVSANIGGNAMQIHLLSGYTVLALVLFRILWGFLGSTHARFASFVRSPASALAYLKSLRRGDAGRHLGHNPAGAWSVIFMLTVLLVQAGTGLFANDDIATEGPLAKLLSKDLSDRITGIHHLNVKLLYALIAMHLAAVAFYVIGKQENLVKPMITGFKNVANGSDGDKQRPARIWLAAALLTVCAGAVSLLVKFS